MYTSLLIKQNTKSDFSANICKSTGVRNFRYACEAHMLVFTLFYGLPTSVVRDSSYSNVNPCFYIMTCAELRVGKSRILICDVVKKNIRLHITLKYIVYLQ